MKTALPDLGHVLQVAQQIAGLMLEEALVIKSTVPVGTADMVMETMRKHLAERGKSDLKTHVVSNPEFLKEGSAVADCMRPDRIIIGCSEDKPRQQLTELYVAV